MLINTVPIAAVRISIVLISGRSAQSKGKIWG